MTEEHHESQSDDEPKLDEEVMEDLDTPSEEAEDVKGGRASSEPFIGRCG